MRKAWSLEVARGGRCHVHRTEEVMKATSFGASPVEEEEAWVQLQHRVSKGKTRD